jgi:hypothetical protein
VSELQDSPYLRSITKSAQSDEPFYGEQLTSVVGPRTNPIAERTKARRRWPGAIKRLTVDLFSDFGRGCLSRNRFLMGEVYPARPILQTPSAKIARGSSRPDSGLPTLSREPAEGMSHLQSPPWTRYFRLMITKSSRGNEARACVCARVVQGFPGLLGRLGLSPKCSLPQSQSDSIIGTSF